MTELIKFDVYEEYLAEGKKNADTLGQFFARYTEAEKAHAELVAEYEAVIVVSVKSGKDATATLDALDERISTADRVRKRRYSEYSAACAPVTTKIRRVDVINAYRADYLPKVQASFIPDFKARIKQARDLLLSTTIDLQAAESDYRLYIDEIKNVSKVAHENGETPALMSLNRPFELLSMQDEIRQIVDDMKEALAEGAMPEDATYIKGGK